MHMYLRFLTAAAAVGGLAAPAAAQYPYPQPYPQQYPPAYPQPYPGQPGYGYQQPYGGNAIDQIIGQLLGNRYNVTDRQAVSRCASAAMVQAQNQVRGYGQGYGQQPYGQPYGQGYAQPYGGYGANVRVTAITNVERRSDGLRVSGLLDSGLYRGQGYGQAYGQAYGQGYGDLTFRCSVDYRGYVSNVRVRRNDNYRRY